MKILDQPLETSVIVLANNEEFRNKIDSYFDEELTGGLSQKLKLPTDEIEQQIRDLSIDMQIVPEDVLYIIDKSSLKILSKETNKAKWIKTFLDYEPLCKFHINKLLAENESATNKLTESMMTALEETKVPINWELLEQIYRKSTFSSIKILIIIIIILT